MEIKSGRGYVYSIQYHIVWCVKYRHKIIKEIEKEDGRDWVDVDKISDTNFEILTNLGYYIISW